MNKKDYYEILGIGKDASIDQVKKAYRKLAHQYHPDKGGGAESEKKFKEINEAYQILSNPQKRKAYDQFGHTDPSGQGFNWQQYQGAGQGFSGFDFDFGDLGGMGDIFETFFGGGGGRTRSRRGQDLETQITIDFEEAAFGTEKSINLNKNFRCDICDGSGAQPGSKQKTCPTCQGRGRIQTERRTILGTFAQEATCEVCQGLGRVPEEACRKCKGKGILHEDQKVRIKIPAGVDNGQTIKLSGLGEAIKGGSAGDLYVHVYVRPHEKIKRDGYDLANTVVISFAEAALGTVVDVPTIDGKVKLKIPAGTQSEKIFKLSGKGVPHINGRSRGNHLVTVKVKVPEKLTARQKELLKEFEKEEGNEKPKFWPF